MPRRLLSTTADASRDKLFWLTASAMIVGQVVAFWMLCSQQVRAAEVRDASVQVERMAVSDCLRHAPRASLNSCSPNGVEAPAMMSGVVPVNYVYR